MSIEGISFICWHKKDKNFIIRLFCEPNNNLDMVYITQNLN